MIGRNADEMNHINTLRTELGQIPLNISMMENQIAVDERAVGELNAKAEKLQVEQIQPVQSTVDSLKARIAQLTLPSEIQRLQDKLDLCNATSSELRSQIETLNLRLAPVNAEINHLNCAIEINNALEELDNLHSNLQQVQNRISNLRANYRSYEAKFTEANAQYRSAEDALASLKYQQDTDYIYNHIPWSHHHHHHYGYYDGGDFLHAIGDSVLTTNIISQQDTVNRLRRQVNDLQDSLQSISNGIRSAENDETRIHGQINQKEQNISRNRVKAREKDLNKSSVSLRDLKRIQERQREPMENNRIHLQKQLGVLMSEKVSYECQIQLTAEELSRAELLARPFAEVQDVSALQSQLNENQFQLGKFMGDHAVIGGDVSIRLVNIEKNRRHISDYKSRAANLEYELLYPNAYDRFKELLHNMPNETSAEMRKLYQYGWDLLRYIDEDEAHAIRKNKPQSFDQASHADVLKACAAVLESHASIDSIRNLNTAMERSESYIHGRPSIAKKVLGGIMVFLGGAILIAGSSILGLMVPFASWPMSYAGIAAGAALLAGGIALIVSGRRKAADKSLHQFRDHAPAAFKGSMFNPVVVMPSVQTLLIEPSAPPFHAVK